MGCGFLGRLGGGGVGGLGLGLLLVRLLMMRLLVMFGRELWGFLVGVAWLIG